jgi:hypothetical protein
MEKRVTETQPRARGRNLEEGDEMRRRGPRGGVAAGANEWTPSSTEKKEARIRGMDGCPKACDRTGLQEMKTGCRLRYFRGTSSLGGADGSPASSLQPPGGTVHCPASTPQAPKGDTATWISKPGKREARHLHILSHHRTTVTRLERGFRVSVL